MRLRPVVLSLPLRLTFPEMREHLKRQCSFGERLFFKQTSRRMPGGLKLGRVVASGEWRVASGKVEISYGNKTHSGCDGYWVTTAFIVRSQRVAFLVISTFWAGHCEGFWSGTREWSNYFHLNTRFAKGNKKYQLWREWRTIQFMQVNISNARIPSIFYDFVPYYWKIFPILWQGGEWRVASGKWEVASGENP